MQVGLVGAPTGSSCRFCHCALPRQAIRRVSVMPSRRTTRHVVAALDSEVLLAVTQQGLLFVLAAGAETAFTRTELKDGTPGRPAIVPVAALCAAVVAGIVIAQQGGGAAPVGLTAGTLACAGICTYSLKRAIDAPFDPEDWPGKKAWPALTVLLSFFGTWIFAQGLAQSLG